MPSCKEQIISQDYADYLVEYGGIPESIYEKYETDCIQIFNERYGAFHLSTATMDLAVNALPYSAIPKIFGLMDTSSMDHSGITRLHRQPYLNLQGQGVLVGIVDTGIDYTHPAFLDSGGRTRIVSLWDQTLETGHETDPRLPTADYGTIYSEEAINRALQSDAPLSVVPSTDALGHGTFIAGIAAGSEDVANDFIGAAPRAAIAVVKLKEAKRYLRDFYLISEDVPAYQENDIMAGVAYLIRLARALGKPISICIGLGTSLGNHSGGAYISRYLDMAGSLFGVSIACAAGNESNRGSHFLGNVDESQPFTEVELRVGEGDGGFVTELWGQAPDIYSVGFVSPAGEVVAPLSPKIGEVQRISFFLEPTEIFVNHSIVEAVSGGEVIRMRFVSAVPGIWRIRVYGSNLLRKVFHMWLPIHGFIGEDTQFLMPQPDNTVTTPADSWVTLSVGAYDHYNNSIYLYSGRGFTPSGTVVPDFCAPGVEVYGPVPSGRYAKRSGTSVAAAHACGGAAQLLQWAIFNRQEYTTSTNQIRQYLIRGARRQTDMAYPNKLWGYGAMDVYHSFEIFIT